jgi:hypothetical protein
MDENNSIRLFFDSIIHDRTEKKIMNLILNNRDANDIVKQLLEYSGGEGDD